jgi:hypothetical protein
MNPMGSITMTVTPEEQRVFLSLLHSQKSIEQLIQEQEPRQQQPLPDFQEVLDCDDEDMFVFNRQSVDYDKILSFDPNEKAFSHSKKDQALSATAARKAKSRAVQNIVTAVKSCGNIHYQAVALQSALVHPELQQIGKSIGYSGETAQEVKVVLFHQEQQNKMIALARKTEKKNAKPNDDKRSFSQSIFVSIADSPTSNKVGLRARAKMLGLPQTTAWRMFTSAKLMWARLKNLDKSISWSTVKKKKGQRKVTEPMRRALHTWVLNHPNVVDLPIARDTLFIKDPETGVKKRTGKLLLEILVQELHNNLLEPSVNGGLGCARSPTGEVLISDTALRYLLPPQLRPMTERHKQMCGCEVCLSVHSFQSTLNAWRFRQAQRLEAISLIRFTEYSDIVLPGGQHWHPEPKDAILEIQCPTIGNLQFPHWKCVL